MRSLEYSWERARLVWEWRRWVESIASAVKEVLGSGSKVYVFGSAVRGELTAASDIDILVVSEQAPRSLKERGHVKSLIFEKAGLPLIHPFEIHIVDEEEAEVYFKHIRKDIVRVA